MQQALHPRYRLAVESGLDDLGNGVLLLDHGRAAEAAAAFREAILRDPTDEETIAGLRRAEALLGVAPDAPAVAPAPAVTATG